MHTYSIERSPVDACLGLGWSSLPCGQFGVPSSGTAGSGMASDLPSDQLRATFRRHENKTADLLNSLDIQAFSADRTPEKTIEGSLPMN